MVYTPLPLQFCFHSGLFLMTYLAGDGHNADAVALREGQARFHEPCPETLQFQFKPQFP